MYGHLKQAHPGLHNNRPNGVLHSKARPPSHIGSATFVLESFQNRTR